MTKKEANELAIKKWQWIVDNWDYDWDYDWDYNWDAILEVYPELKNLKNDCSYCEMYCIESGGCGECPLIIDGLTCCDKNHPYMSWVNFVEEFENGTKYAKKILRLIKKVSKTHVD